MPTFQKCENGLANPTLVLRNIMGHILLDTSSNPMKDKVFWNCQDEFSRIKSCQTNKIAFHKEVTGLQNEEERIIFSLTLVKSSTLSPIASVQSEWSHKDIIARLCGKMVTALKVVSRLKFYRGLCRSNLYQSSIINIRVTAVHHLHECLDGGMPSCLLTTPMCSDQYASEHNCHSEIS